MSDKDSSATLTRRSRDLLDRARQAIEHSRRVRQRCRKATDSAATTLHVLRSESTHRAEEFESLRSRTLELCLETKERLARAEMHRSPTTEEETRDGRQHERRVGPKP